MGMIDVVEAIDKGNKANYQQQAADMTTTIAIGVRMVDLQVAFTKLLHQDVDKLTKDAEKGTAKSKATMQADELKYKEDSAKMDSQTNDSRSMFDAAKQQVTRDTESQKNIVQIDESVSSVQSTTSNLLQQGGRYGK